MIPFQDMPRPGDEERWMTAVQPPRAPLPDPLDEVRNPQLAEARKMFTVKATRNWRADRSPALAKGEVRDLKVMQDGNMTIVVINEKWIGWAKFNPADTKLWWERNRLGDEQMREESKYKFDTGVRLATSRALDKMLGLLPPRRSSLRR